MPIPKPHEAPETGNNPLGPANRPASPAPKPVLCTWYPHAEYKDYEKCGSCGATRLASAPSSTCSRYPLPTRKGV